MEVAGERVHGLEPGHVLQRTLQGTSPVAAEPTKPEETKYGWRGVEGTHCPSGKDGALIVRVWSDLTHPDAFAAKLHELFQASEREGATR